MTDKELSILKNRLLELSARSISQNIYCFTEFLGLAQQTVFRQIERELKASGITMNGGAPFCERVMVRFGDPDSFGYEEAFPIVIIKISPLEKKDRETLSHRDILGACMNLGITRGTLGDIFFKDGDAYLFCNKTIAPHIMEELYQVRHTHVSTQIYQGPLDFIAPVGQEMELRVNTERLDSVIAKLYHLSREEAQNLFKREKVFVNGLECKTVHSAPQKDAVISVRGFGRFIYLGPAGTTKKDKTIIKVTVYK